MSNVAGVMRSSSQLAALAQFSDADSQETAK
jgi:hypothetical protein